MVSAICRYLEQTDTDSKTDVLYLKAVQFDELDTLGQRSLWECSNCIPSTSRAHAKESHSICTFVELAGGGGAKSRSSRNPLG